MNYTPYLIANFATGFDTERQPWLLPDDAQFELLDGYIYLGVWNKRQGYSQYATGERGGSTYTESRMIHTITSVAMTGAINGINQVFTASLTPKVSRGSVVVSGTNPVQSFTDNGNGQFIDAMVSIGTVDYNTGAVSITLPVAPIAASSVTVAYSIFNNLPVMGIMNYYTQANSRELIVADTRYVNRYNTVTNRLVDISPSPLFTGDETNFFSWTNYPDPNGLKRLLFVNNKDPIHQWDGTTVTIYPVYIDSTVIASMASGVVGDGTTGPYTINTPANTGILPFTLSLNDPISAQTVTDNGFSVLIGDGTGTVDYQSGTIVVTFTAAIGVGNPINIAYTQLNTLLESCLHIKQFKDRLILLSTIETGGVIKGLRIRISGTGAFGDIFTQDALGAGFIDLSDQTFIQACDFNRDDLIIFTESSTWVMKYTGNDTVPFALDKLDESRGSQAPYGTITYLNRTSAASTRGLILTDGYSIERSDGKIPNFSFNEINQKRFKLCFAGSVDEDRDHYLLYPVPTGSATEVSTRILVTNYEEFNISIYRIPLSCMGNYISSSNVTWNDLTAENGWLNWDILTAKYGSWNAFNYTEGAPYAIGGGHNGEIFQLNVEDTEDYPVRIRGISVVDQFTLRVTTDFQNYKIGDYINIEGVLGMTEANSKQYPIKLIFLSNYTFDLDIPDTTGFTAYTSLGNAQKVIQFSSKTKKFNPFVSESMKVRCGWVYFYVSTTDTNLTTNKYITAAANSNPLLMSVIGHGYPTGTKVFINAMQGMTELNGNFYTITSVDINTISLDGVNGEAFGTYTGSGFTSIPVDAKLEVRVIVNDREKETQINQENAPYDPTPYEVNLTKGQPSNGIKKWYKLFVNQVGRFIQFEFSNTQAGCQIQIHAVMGGFAGVGRLI